MVVKKRDHTHESLVITFNLKDSHISLEKLQINGGILILVVKHLDIGGEISLPYTVNVDIIARC